jgi:acetylornithine deacetylase/succinyl-diaminopimelate desuccinylase-like protein
VKGVPTVVFGPSSENLAHVDDEYIEVEELVAGCRGYYGIAAEVLSREWRLRARR